MELRAVVAAGLTAVFAATAHAQPAGWVAFGSVTPVVLGEGDLDGGGSVKSWSAFVRVGGATQVGGGNSAGLTLNLDETRYTFSGPTAFGASAPWGTLQRIGVSAPLTFALQDGWGLLAVPSVDWFGEKGAASGESLVWGATVAGIRGFADGNRLGFGIGVFSRLEETQVFPLLVVDWKLSERWRLVNPLPAGPTGPVGIELDYRIDDGWSLGFGVARRSIRFRLSEQGPVANGIGEERIVPVFVRASGKFDNAVALNLYAGLATSRQLRVEDATGHLLQQVDADPAPILGATLSVRF